MFHDWRRKRLCPLGQAHDDLFFKVFFKINGLKTFIRIRQDSLKVKLTEEISSQTLPVPFSWICLIRAESRHDIFNHLVENGFNGFANILTTQNLFTLAINDLTLTVHDIIIVDQVFTDFKVVRFDLLLSTFDRFGNHAMFNRLILGDFELFHHERDPVRAEDSQQIILKAHKETAFTWITLTP